MRIARTEMKVAEPTFAATGPPLHCEYDQIERTRRLYLDPRGTSAAGGVCRGERLHHHTLVSALERICLKTFGFPDIARDDARHAQSAGNDAVEPLQTLR